MEPVAHPLPASTEIVVDLPADETIQVAPTARLVAGSGIQFLDFRISTDALSQTFGRFVEDPDTGQGPVLIPLWQRPDYEGVEWHPATGRALRPGETLWITGYGAIEPFLGTWLPLPYLRVIGHDKAGDPGFDDGPANWARLFMAPPPVELRHASAIDAVIAFDTRVCPTGRLDHETYLAPSVDDVRHGATFRLASDPVTLAGFLSERWIDVWLTRVFEARQTESARAAPGATAASAFALEHIARYLSLLSALDRVADLPCVRFYDAFAGQGPVARGTPVDLLIDIGDDRTTSVLCDSTVHQRPDRLDGVYALPLRELNRPTVVHTGPIRTRGEFDALTFGNTAASRLSGRADAFSWPSPMRIGEEAARLSLRASAVPGITGLGKLRSSLDDLEAHPTFWRTSRDDRFGSTPGPAVAGEILAQLAEDGRVITKQASGIPPAMRPRFSASSLLSMFIAELILHTLSEINRTSQGGHQHEVRSLRRVVVACPSDADENERRLLLERVAGAIELVWNGYAWPAAGSPVTPAKPQAALGFDASLSAQLVYLHDEVQNGFAGNIRQFVSLAQGGDGVTASRKGISIASLDICAAATSFAVVDYELDDEHGIRPRLSVADRGSISAASLVELILGDVVLRSIRDALQAAHHSRPNDFVDEFLLGDAALDPNFAPRVRHAILEPAAEALLDVARDIDFGPMARGLHRFTLASLVARGGGRLEPLAAMIESRATDEGARGFRLAEVDVAILPRRLARLMASHLEPLLERVSDVVMERQCDILLLTGPFADLAALKQVLHARLPLAPHRIVDLSSRPIGLIQGLLPPPAVSRHAVALRLVPLVGTALAASTALGSLGISLLPPDPHAAPSLAIESAGLRDIGAVHPAVSGSRLADGNGRNARRSIDRARPQSGAP
ncbi:MAG: virulence factor SrfB [Hyphomicrobiaceae bacterium]